MLIGTAKDWWEKAIQNVQSPERESWSELQTRRCLIEPLLAACGIDVWNPEQCKEEEQLGSTGRGGRGTVDYILFSEGKAYLAIEAKKASESVGESAYVDQICNYLVNDSRKISLGVVTNGATWIFVDPRGQRDLQSRVRWRAEIPSDEGLVKLAVLRPDGYSRLLEYWDRLDELDEEEATELSRAQGEIARRGIRQEYERCREDELGRLIDALRALIASGVDESQKDREVTPPDDLAPVPPYGAKAVRATWRGRDLRIRRWKELLVEAARIALKEGRLALPLLWRHGRGERVLLAKQREDFPEDWQRRAAHKVDEGCWVDTVFSTPACVRAARLILEQAGLDPNQLNLEWE